MEFWVLGPLQVLQEGQTVRITGPRERALLAALLLRPGEAVSTDRLIDLLWGDAAPGNAANALQAVVTRLRKALGPHGRDLLVTRTPGYALAVDPDQVDAVRFEGLLVQARDLLRYDPATAADLLGQALGLWRGPALQDLADHDLVQPEIARLEELRLAAFEDRIEAELALGRHSKVLGELQALVAAHPLRERLRGQLRVALYRAGRQAEALGIYQQTRVVLGEELGVDPAPALQALHQQILRQDPSLAAPIPTSRERGQALPARISSFVGRELELEDLRRLLARSRLVTVIGPGGSGKTSLAVEVARAAVGPEEETGAAIGAYFVDLAPVTDPAHVPAAVAATVGLRGGPGGAAGTPTPPEIQLEGFVRADQPLLLLLDNCEHLIEAVAHLTERLLRVAAGARVLVTSREPLGLTGEVVWSIPGLATPDPSLPAEQLRSFDAVRLFTERAAAARTGFGLDERTGPLVAEICRRLDGLPLAIELAAARTRTLPVQEIASRLDDRFRLLTSGARTASRRQQTLRAAIDWSYDLLSEPERLLFGRLSVFAGGWSLEAAEAVCGDHRVPADQVLDLVSRLVDRSLLQPEPGPAARFRLLETIRAYATERLQELGDLDEVRRRHTGYFLRLAEAAGAHPESAGWLQALEVSVDDLRAALDWALTTRTDDMLLRFAGALGWYWATWHDQEGIQWMKRILDAVPPEASAGYSRALLASAFVESYSPATKQRAIQSVELLEGFGDRSGAGRARLILAFIELMLGGDPAFAERHIYTADQAFAEVGDAWGEALAALSRFRLYLHTGSLQRGITAGRDALDRFRTLGDPWGIPWTTMWLGTATRMAGDVQQATRLFEEAIAVSDHLAYVRCTAHAELGCLAAFQEDHQRAHRHQLAAADLAPTTGSATPWRWLPTPPDSSPGSEEKHPKPRPATTRPSPSSTSWAPRSASPTPAAASAMPTTTSDKPAPRRGTSATPSPSPIRPAGPTSWPPP
jgi:predicted ATPase/DNA-binding SARP family transcriptional activator